MKKDRPAVIYFIRNPAFPNLIKIGRTLDLDKRLKELSRTGVPMPYEALRIIECNEDNYCEIEKHFHTIFEEQRISQDKEFFNVDTSAVDSGIDNFKKSNSYESLKYYNSKEEYHQAKKKQESSSTLQIWMVNMLKPNEASMVMKFGFDNIDEDSPAGKDFCDLMGMWEQFFKKHGSDAHQAPIKIA